MTFWRAWAALVWKDCLSEWRSPGHLLTQASLGILLVVLVGMALDAPNRMPPNWTSGLLWLTLFFTCVLGMSRGEQRETELGAVLAVRLAPVDRSVAFYAKWTTTCLFVWVASAVEVAAFFIILNAPWPAHPLGFIATLAAGLFGLTGLGALVHLVALASSVREVLVPFLMFPLSIPLFLAVTRLTACALTGTKPLPWIWLEVLGGFIVLCAVLPWLLYETITEV
jgi:ABC-type transport system involved in cytochrome c biogenesis permease component